MAVACQQNSFLCSQSALLLAQTCIIEASQAANPALHLNDHSAKVQNWRKVLAMPAGQLEIWRGYDPGHRRWVGTCNSTPALVFVLLWLPLATQRRTHTQNRVAGLQQTSCSHKIIEWNACPYPMPAHATSSKHNRQRPRLLSDHKLFEQCYPPALFPSLSLRCGVGACLVMPRKHGTGKHARSAMCSQVDHSCCGTPRLGL